MIKIVGWSIFPKLFLQIWNEGSKYGEVVSSSAVVFSFDRQFSSAVGFVYTEIELWDKK